MPLPFGPYRLRTMCEKHCQVHFLIRFSRFIFLSCNSPTQLTMDSQRVNPPTRVSKLGHADTKQGSKARANVPDQKPSRHRIKRLQRQGRRQWIHKNTDMRKVRSAEERAAIKNAHSLRLQRRAARGYWDSAVKHSKDAALSDKRLLDEAKSTEERNKILFAKGHASNDREKFRTRIAYPFKRANLALHLLQSESMLRDRDFKLIENEDIEKIVLGRKIIKKM